ncbi:helix-turn-helix domain-containing protein [Rothia koreensis]|jgi:excisionase family DNA binding protein|uniref:helix-turn-helix domain-containing protein n=1 Tax=Rothia koreensis TaxID=592378 RepID=UPI003F244498
MVAQRFLTLVDVAEILNVSVSQTRAMVRSGELPAIQVGGRGQWRVERAVLEEYIAEAYRRSAAATESQEPDQA